MNSNEKKVLDKLINAYNDQNISTLYEIAEINPNDDNSIKIYEALGRIIGNIDGGIEYILERHPKIGDTQPDLIFPISYTKNYDKMEEMIEHSEQYQLDNDYIAILYAGLARSREHRHVVENLLMDTERLHKFSSEAIVNIVCALKDCKWVEKILTNEELVLLTTKEEFKKLTSLEYTPQNSSNKIAFFPEETIAMIVSTENKEYIKKYTTDKTLIDKMRYTQDDIAILAIELEDEELMEKLIKHREKLRRSTILKLILAIKNQEIKKDAMRYPAFYKLESGDICQIAHEGKFSKEILEEMPTFAWSNEGEIALAILMGEDPFLKIQLEDIDAEIDLPEDMTIGIEIESIGSYAMALRIRKKIEEWVIKKDGSIHGPEDEDGAEIVSTVLTGDNKKTSQSIKKITGLLQNIGQYTNSSCGAHVHIGADYLTSSQAFNNLRELWANNEKILFAIANKEGEIPREAIWRYASPISGEFEEQLPDSVQMNSEEDLGIFKEEIAQKQKSRYSAINFKNLRKDGKGTIEFRLSNGTVDAKTWIENINLYGGLVRAAQEISLIQEKDPDELSDDEKEKIAIFNALGTDVSLKEEERLEYFLKLIIRDPKKRETYRRRYKTNSELIRNNPEIEKNIDNKLAKNPIRYSNKKEIGKVVFTGEKPVDGEQIQQIETNINNDAERLILEADNRGDNTI